MLKVAYRPNGPGVKLISLLLLICSRMYIHMSLKIKTTTTISTLCLNFRVSVNLFNVALFKQEYIFASHFLLKGLDGRGHFLDCIDPL